MANKTIQTRIRNKYDSLSAWQNSTNTLLAGEIAIVAVPTATSYTNPVTGKEEPVVELLMKVGDGTKTFSQLPWLSAKASDVYGWAKEPTANNAPVSFIETKTDGSTVTHETTLSDVFGRLAVAEADIDAAAAVASAASNKLTGITGTVTSAISTAITTALQGLDFTPSTTDTVRPGVNGCFISKVTQVDGKVTAEVKKFSLDDITFQITPGKVNTNNATYTTLDAWIAHIDSAVSGILDSVTVNQTGTGVVKSVEKDNTKDGQINVTRAQVGADDIASNAIVEAKISNSAVTTNKINNSAVTEAKLKDSAVTNAKVAAGIAAEKILVAGSVGGTGTNAAEYLDARLSTIAGAISSLNTAVAGGVHFRGILATRQEIIKRLGEEGIEEVLQPGCPCQPLTDGNTAGATEYFTFQDSDTVTEYVPENGDVIISDGIEFIFVAEEGPNRGYWYELGNADRIGDLATSVQGLSQKIEALGIDAPDDIEHKYVSKVTQSEGQIAVEYAQPVAEDILYEADDDRTVKTAIDAINGYINPSSWVSGNTDTVPELIDSKITAAITELEVTESDFTNSSTSAKAGTKVVTAVTQNEGKIAVTRQALATASSATKGLVQLDADGGAVKYDTYIASEQVHTQFESRVSPILANYVHFDADETNSDTGRLRVGADTTDYIIFDCGGAN